MQAYRYINSNCSGTINLTISFAVRNRSCENSQPGCAAVAFNVKCFNFHDVNSVVTD